MICNECHNLISARIDGELLPEQAAALEVHVAGCQACRHRIDEMHKLDETLRLGFAPRRQHAASVADRVIAELPPARTPRRAWRIVAVVILSAAAGFALAAWLLPAAAPRVNGSRFAAGPAGIAQLTLATGPIEYRAAQAEDWALLATGADIAAGGILRTGPSSRCELRTTDGSEIRLNADSELQISSTRSVSLVRGQSWTSVARAVEPFAVRLTDDSSVVALGTQFDVRRLATETQVTVVEGRTRVTAAGAERTLEAGEAIKLADGRLGEVHKVDDLVVATRWIHELLVLKGRDNPELGRRIDDLLAQVGETKVDYFYEQEVKALGDHCALPLTRFIQSDRSQGNETKRVRAAQILSDIAQPWCIPELISLLSDTDGRVREFAARALLRLTGQTHGRTPESWRENGLIACENTIDRWQQWWAANVHRYPGLP